MLTIIKVGHDIQDMVRLGSSIEIHTTEEKHHASLNIKMKITNINKDIKVMLYTRTQLNKLTKYDSVISKINNNFIMDQIKISMNHAAFKKKYHS